MAKKRILFVDDDPTLLRGLAAMLHYDRARWDMTFVRGGVAGLAALREATFDVVVTDLQMPELDGIALLEAARASWPKTARVMLTASSVEGLVIDAAAILVKPCTVRELRETIARLTAAPASGDPA